MNILFIEAIIISIIVAFVCYYLLQTIMIFKTNIKIIKSSSSLENILNKIDAKNIKESDLKEIKIWLKNNKNNFYLYSRTNNFLSNLSQKQTKNEKNK